MNRIQPESQGQRRGAIGVTLIIVLLIVQMLIVAIVLAGGRDQDTTIKRMDSIRAFYASEGGMNMAVKEMMASADSDGDGTVGSISNDGNSANNPSIGSGKVYVTASTASGTTTLTAYGSAGTATRKIQSTFGAASARNADGQQLASSGTLGSPGTLTTISAMVKGPPPKLLRYGLYTDVAGSPSAKVVETTAQAVSSNSALYWHTLPLISTSLSAGNYWVALGFEHSNEYYSYAGSGVTKTNNNDPIPSGFSNPWGSTVQTLSRQMNVFGTVMLTTTGSFTFASDAEYQNVDPPTAGVFRDVTSAGYILRGNDLGTGGYTSLNFNAGGGIMISNAYTAYDSDPTNATQSNFTGSIRLTADFLFTGGGQKFIGLAALHNEIIGQDGLAVLIRENGGNDRLDFCRMPQNGDVSGATFLANSGNFNGIAASNWYRLVVDVTIYNGSVDVNGNIYTHTTTSNPNSSVSSSALASVTYGSTVASLTGLSTTGECCVVFDATSNSGRGSVTNLVVHSNPVMLPALTQTSSVLGWAEVP